MSDTPRPLVEQTIIDRVRAKGISSSRMNDDDLFVVISACLDEYLSYRPDVKLSEEADLIETEAGVGEYSVPDDCLWIIDVFWAPNFPFIGEQIIDLTNSRTEDETTLMIKESKIAEMRKMYGGNWRALGRDILLVPTPTQSGIKVGFMYATEKSLSELDGIVDNLFIDLVFYSALSKMSTEMLLAGGWRAGAYSVNDTASRIGMEIAERKLKDVRLLIANSYIGRR